MLGAYPCLRAAGSLFVLASVGLAHTLDRAQEAIPRAHASKSWRRGFSNSQDSANYALATPSLKDKGPQTERDIGYRALRTSALWGMGRRILSDSAVPRIAGRAGSLADAVA